MKTKNVVAPDSPAAAACVIAALLARDDRVDWREVEFLERSGAFPLIGVKRSEFLRMLAEALGKHGSTRTAGAPGREPAFDAIRSRRLQLVVAGLLVYIAEIDREVRPEEASLVRRAFAHWQITPLDLQREMSVPLARSLAALYGLRGTA